MNGLAPRGPGPLLARLSRALEWQAWEALPVAAGFITPLDGFLRSQL